MLYEFSIITQFYIKYIKLTYNVPIQSIKMSILDLPINILHYIANSLSLSDLYSLIRFNKKFNKTLSSEKFWNYKLLTAYQSFWKNKPNKLTSRNFVQRIVESGTLYESTGDSKEINEFRHIHDHVYRFRSVGYIICMVDIWGNYYQGDELVASEVWDLVRGLRQYYINFDHQLTTLEYSPYLLDNINKYGEYSDLKAFTTLDDKLYAGIDEEYEYVMDNVQDFIVLKNTIVCQQNRGLTIVRFFKTFENIDSTEYKLDFSTEIRLKSGVLKLIRFCGLWDIEFLDQNHRLCWFQVECLNGLARIGIRKDQGKISEFITLAEEKTSQNTKLRLLK